MIGRDLGLWAVFRQNLPFPYTGFYFDVALGKPPEPVDGVSSRLNEAWAFLLAKRIDAVGVLADRYDIIEVRRGAGQAALGALRLYGHLWRSDPPDEKETRLFLVTDSADPDTLSLARADGVTVVQLMPTPSPAT